MPFVLTLLIAALVTGRRIHCIIYFPNLGSPNKYNQLPHFFVNRYKTMPKCLLSTLTILRVGRPGIHGSIPDKTTRIPAGPPSLYTKCTRNLSPGLNLSGGEAEQVHSCQQKSIGLKFSKSQTGSDGRYSCYHNSNRFTFPIFAHSCRFSVLHSLQ